MTYIVSKLIKDTFIFIKTIPKCSLLHLKMGGLNLIISDNTVHIDNIRQVFFSFLHIYYGFNIPSSIFQKICVFRLFVKILSVCWEIRNTSSKTNPLGNFCRDNHCLTFKSIKYHSSSYSVHLERNHIIANAVTQIFS